MLIRLLIMTPAVGNLSCLGARAAHARPYDTSLKVGLVLEGDAPSPFLQSGELRVTHFGAPGDVNLNFEVLDYDGDGDYNTIGLAGDDGVPE
jgi:hypothetical protein